MAEIPDGMEEVDEGTLDAINRYGIDQPEFVSIVIGDDGKYYQPRYVPPEESRPERP